MRRGRWSARLLVRRLSKPLERIGSWVGARYPFVWFTRLPLWAGGGLLASLFAAIWAGMMSVRPVDLPGLDSTVVLLSSWTFVVYALLLVLVVDLIRRGPAFLSGWQGLRVSGCVFTATVCLLLPQYVFLRIALPRIAAVDTQQQVEATLGRYRSYGSWVCAERDEIERLLHNHGGEIERDLQRWGFPHNLTVVRGCPAAPDFAAIYSIQMPANSVPRTPGALLDPIAYLNTSMSVYAFYERLLTVDAAQHYVRGEVGAFETTRTPTVAHDLLGEYAVGPPITSRLFQLPLVGLLVAASIGFVAATRFYRVRAMKASRAWLSAIRWRPAAMGRAEEWLASRLPTVWASRVHASMPQLIVLVGLGVLISGTFVTDTGLWVAAPAVVAAGFIVLRGQESARHLTSRPWQAAGVLLVHWSAIGLCAALIAWLSGIRVSSEDVVVATAVAMLVGMMLQLARFSSALTSYLTAIVSVALLVACAFVEGRYELLPSLSNDAELVVIAAVCAAVSGVVAHLAERVEARPAVRRLVVGSVLLLATFAGALGSIISVAPSVSSLTPSKIGVIGALIAIAPTVVLRLTTQHRRVLAMSGR